MTDKSDHDLLIETHAIVKRIDTDMSGFVTRKEFWPVKALVYGVTAILLVALVGNGLMRVFNWTMFR